MPSTLRTQFLKRYERLTKAEREEIILEYHGQPYTWNPVMVEVRNFTVMGYNMLKQLNAEGKLECKQ